MTPDEMPKTRSGYVALVGRPNVGKSTLLNAMTGERLSIVTPRPQTTRERVMGIFSDEAAQIIFVDTPGLLEPRYLLQRSMLEGAMAALNDADLVLLVLDATRPEESLPNPEVANLLVRKRDRLFVAINKVDAGGVEAVDRLDAWTRSTLGIGTIRISALAGDGIADLRSALVLALPESPFFYPADDVAVQSTRFFVSEMIRETIFEEFHEEVPYSVAVRIEEFRENTDPIYIRAFIFVERDSQKAILIGKGGAGLKLIGQRSRLKVEAFLDSRVYLDLWVKTMPGWRKKTASLRHLGYPVPKGEIGPAERSRTSNKSRNDDDRRRSKGR